MRVALFFDGNNFYSGWRLTAAESRVDFGQLAGWLARQAGGTQLTGAWYYTGVDGEPQTDAAAVSRHRLAGFLAMLEHVPGFYVKRFPRVIRTTHCSSCQAEHQYSQEKGVDTAMVADMIRLAANDAFDVLVLVTGDADHTPGVAAVRDLGKRVLVSTWGRHGLSPTLRAEVWGHVDLLEGLESFRLAPVSLAVVPPLEGSDLGSEAETEEIRAPTSHPGLHVAFLEELGRAERHFETGYVGLALFLHRWMSSQDLPHGMRRVILDALVAQGKVEVYEADDGKMAVRLAS